MRQGHSRWICDNKQGTVLNNNNNNNNNNNKEHQGISPSRLVPSSRILAVHFYLGQSTFLLPVRVYPHTNLAVRVALNECRDHLHLHFALISLQLHTHALAFGSLISSFILWSYNVHNVHNVHKYTMYIMYIICIKFIMYIMHMT